MPPKSRRSDKEEAWAKLAPATLYLTAAGICLTLCAAVAGLLGVFVLLDETSGARRFGFVSQSQFGDFWRMLTQKNPFFTTIFFNGGTVMTIFLGKKLYSHKKALQAEAKRRAAVAGKKKE